MENILNLWFGSSCHPERGQFHGKCWLENKKIKKLKLEMLQECKPCIAIWLLEVSAVCSCLSDNVRMALRPWTKLYPDRLCLITYRVTQLPTFLLLLACGHVLLLTLPFKSARKKVPLNILGVKKTSFSLVIYSIWLSRRRVRWICVCTISVHQWMNSLHITGIWGGLISTFSLSFYFISIKYMTSICHIWSVSNYYPSQYDWWY